MRIIGTLFIATAISGCGSIANTAFDNVEASRYSDIYMTSRFIAERCESSDAVRSLLPMLVHQADGAATYSSVKANNPRITEAGGIISGLVVDLNKRYAESKPSVGYCRVKLGTISIAAEKVARSISRKELLSPIAID